MQISISNIVKGSFIGSAFTAISRYFTRVTSTGGIYEGAACAEAAINRSSILDKASLIFSPSGYKEDLLYSEFPLDGSGDLSFTRASNGTRVNSAGFIEVCPWNLLGYSEEFNNAIYTKRNSTILANTISAPNGTTTADKLQENTANDRHDIYADFSCIVGTSYTISVYAKQSERRYCFLSFGSSAINGNNSFFDLQDGVVVSTPSGVVSNIESVGGGWFRCSISATASSSATAYFVSGASANGTSITYQGVSGSGIYIWGAQLNIGSTAKPYFPTTDRLNVARLTYQNGGGGCPSLLLEKQSTNLALYSEQFDNAAWTKDGVTISANATTSPDGTQNADKIIGAASSGNKIIFQVNSITLGQPFTASAFFKKGEYKNAFLRVGGQTANPYVIYDLDTQSVVSTSGASSTQIESMGNGWYRISLTSLSATTTVIAPNVAFAPNSGYTISATNVLQYTGDGTSGGFAWGAQIEISSYKTSYIPTTSSSATRVADACFKTGISSLIGQSEGTIFADINPEEFVNGSYLGITDGTITNRIIFGFESGSVNSGTLLVFGLSGLSSGGTYTRGQRIKVALAYKSGDSVLYVNGSQVQTATTTFSGSFSQFRFDSFAGTQNFIGKVNESLLSKTRLTNTELASLTTI